MKLSDRFSIEEVYETWMNGNISEAKKHVARMDKVEFIDFIEFCRENGVMPYKIRPLVA